MPELNASEVKRAIENLKRHKLPGTEQILEELIKAVGRTICSEIYKLTNSIWNKQELPKKWKESINVPNYKKDKKKKHTVVIIEAYHFRHLCTKFYLTSCCQG